MKILEKDQLESFNLLKDDEIFKKYIFDKEELEKFKIDISFIEPNGILNETKHVVNYVLSEIKVYPEIKPIVQILKRFLFNFKLNSSFKGN